MLQQIRLVFAAFVAFTTVAGCAASAEPTSPDVETETVNTAQQAAMTSGFFRTFYSDATFTTPVGTLNWDCDPNYREQEGEETIHYRQYRYDCPGYNDPLLPSVGCNVCSTYVSNGQTFTSCTLVACP